MLEIERRSAISWLFCVATAFVIYTLIFVAAAFMFALVFVWWDGTAKEVADITKLPSFWILMLLAHGLSIFAAASFLGSKCIVKYNLLISVLFLSPTIYSILFPNPSDWDLLKHPQLIRFAYLISGVAVFYLVSGFYKEEHTTTLIAK